MCIEHDWWFLGKLGENVWSARGWFRLCCVILTIYIYEYTLNNILHKCTNNNNVGSESTHRVLWHCAAAHVIRATSAHDCDLHRAYSQINICQFISNWMPICIYLRLHIEKLLPGYTAQPRLYAKVKNMVNSRIIYSNLCIYCIIDCEFEY